LVEMTESGNSKSGEPDPRQAPDTPIKSVLSIALIGPNDDRRRTILGVLSEYQGAKVSEFTSFPPDLDELPKTVGDSYDVVVLDVESDPDYVFNLVERISSNSTASVMVYSAESDVKQAVRFMQAGAREYFTLPLVAAEVVAALTRAATHPPAAQAQSIKTAGQVFVFLGAKGGCGVTSPPMLFRTPAGSIRAFSPRWSKSMHRDCQYWRPPTIFPVPLRPSRESTS
jgi:CheY-like chemotaxis protein